MEQRAVANTLLSRGHGVPNFFDTVIPLEAPVLLPLLAPLIHEVEALAPVLMLRAIASANRCNRVAPVITAAIRVNEAQQGCNVRQRDRLTLRRRWFEQGICRLGPDAHKLADFSERILDHVGGDGRKLIEAHLEGVGPGGCRLRSGVDRPLKKKAPDSRLSEAAIDLILQELIFDPAGTHDPHRAVVKLEP